MLGTIVLIVVCMLVAALSAPLMFKKVPPNEIYGVRTRKTLADESAWFEVNALAGRLFFTAALFSMVVLMTFSATWLRSGWLQLFAVVIPLGVAVVMTLRFERSLR